MSIQTIVDKGLVSLTNKLLQRLHVSKEVKCIGDITSEIFVTIFEGLYGERLSEVRVNPLTKEDCVHNCQVVIDCLATKVLNTSLSHITGENIVNRNRMAINNLLEIFNDLLEFLTEKIDAIEDVVDDNDDDLDDLVKDKEFLSEWIHQKHLEHHEDHFGFSSPSAACSRFAWGDTATVGVEKSEKILKPDKLCQHSVVTEKDVVIASKEPVLKELSSVTNQVPEVLRQSTQTAKELDENYKAGNKWKDDLFPSSSTFKPAENNYKFNVSRQTSAFFNTSIPCKKHQANASRELPENIPSRSPVNAPRNPDTSNHTERSNPETMAILEQYRPGQSTNQLLDMIESALKQLQVESQPVSYDNILPKQVHFEDKIKKKVNFKRHKCPSHDRDWKTKKQLQFLENNYLEDLAQITEDISTQLKKDKTAANMKKYHQNCTDSKMKGPRPAKRNSVRSHPHLRRKPVTSSTNSSNTDISAEALLPTLLEELPLLELSTETWHELWKKNILQLEHLTKSYYEKCRKKDMSNKQMKDAERRRAILYDIMKKELSHHQRLSEIKERKKQHFEVKNRLHERRIISARARRYYDDFSVRMRSRMMKRNTKEEMLFKSMFKESLRTQKDRVLELQKYVDELSKQKAHALQNDIASIENYYCNQFAMLSEAMKKQVAEKQMIRNEQIRLKSNMKRELRQQMEKDIHEIQHQLCEDEDNIHFRQLDTERLKGDLQMANYIFKSRPQMSHKYV
ncbi:centrosomal protein of 95 kDa-like [Argonauta hians]